MDRDGGRGHYPHRHDGLDRFFNRELRGKDLLFRNKEEVACRRNESGRDEDRYLRSVFKVLQFIRHKTEHIVPGLRELHKYRLTKRARSEERRVGKECRSRWSAY